MWFFSRTFDNVLGTITKKKGNKPARLHCFRKKLSKYIKTLGHPMMKNTLFIWKWLSIRNGRGSGVGVYFFFFFFCKFNNGVTNIMNLAMLAVYATQSILNVPNLV